MTAEDVFFHEMRNYEQYAKEQPAEALKEWAARENKAALQRDMEHLAKALGRPKEWNRK